MEQKVHHRIHNSPPRVRILIQMNPVQALPSDFLNIRFNIILPAVAQLVEALRCTRKVAGLIPDGVTAIFHWHNPSDRTMALGSTQPLTRMSTRNVSWGVKAAGAQC